MNFTAKDVSALRERTSCGMMDCKKALVEADGDMERAVELLRERGLAAQAKKAGRIAAEGVVYAISAADCGVIVEVNSETDFVAKNEKFMGFVKAVANAVMANDPADVDALLACKDENGTIDEQLRELVLTIGENMKVRRFQKVDGVTVAYNHPGNTHAALISFDADAAVAAKDEFIAFGKDIAMQAVSMNPTYLAKEDVPASVLENEKTVMLAQMEQDPKFANKPAAALEKIVAGKLGKYYEENCLLEQSFVKDNKITVAQYVAQTAKELGGAISVKAFYRFEKGEGLEKRNEDFAAEVAAQINKA